MNPEEMKQLMAILAAMQQQQVKVTYHAPRNWAYMTAIEVDSLDNLYTTWTGARVQVEYATLEARLTRRVYDEI